MYKDLYIHICTYTNTYISICIYIITRANIFIETVLVINLASVTINGITFLARNGCSPASGPRLRGGNS
jgi:hypothetical protein